MQQWLNVVPQQARGQPLAAQIAVDVVMADAREVISQVRHRVVNRAAEQVLAVVKFAKAHLFSLELPCVSPEITSQEYSLLMLIALPSLSKSGVVG